MLTTTLKEILKHDPCGKYCKGKYGYTLLLKNLNKIDPDDDPLTVLQILESNGIEDAVWSLRCFDYRDYCLFLADVVELVLHIYENEHDDPAPRLAIQGIRDYHTGKITREELKNLSNDAANAATDAYLAAASYAYLAASYADFAAVAEKAKWIEIEQLFIKHFG